MATRLMMPIALFLFISSSLSYARGLAELEGFGSSGSVLTANNDIVKKVTAKDIFTGVAIFDQIDSISHNTKKNQRGRKLLSRKLKSDEQENGLIGKAQWIGNIESLLGNHFHENPALGRKKESSNDKRHNSQGNTQLLGDGEWEGDDFLGIIDWRETSVLNRDEHEHP